MYNMYGSKSNGWTIVRVWLPKKGGSFVTAHEAASGGNVGHASLQTKNRYASFWPTWESAKKGGSLGALLGTAQGCTIPDPRIDIILESRDFLIGIEEKRLDEILRVQDPNKALDDALSYLESIGKKKGPDVVIVLNTLNVVKIESAFDKFTASSVSTKWSLMGANVFNVFNKGGGQSCSGLVYELLNAGGAQSLATWDMVSGWWTVAPDAVARFAAQAASSKDEVETSYTTTLPPGISSRITKPYYNLNPHKNGLGYWMGEPGSKKSGCIIS